MSRSRAYCMTINNYDLLSHMDPFVELDPDYLIIGYEIGEQGTEHLQVYMYHRNKLSFNTLKKLFPTAHIEVSKGSYQDNYNYCSKDGVFIEFGDPPSQGQRSDLDEIAEMIEDKVPIVEIAKCYPSQYIRYSKGIECMSNLYMNDRTEKPTVMWIYGTTGTGKTRFATDIDSSYYIKDHTQWWDRYQQQNVIIIDDFDGKWPLRDLLRLLDRYPYQGQVKGGYVKINSATIIFTCDRSPEDVFLQYDAHELAQIMRRIDFIYVANVDGTRTTVKSPEYI